MTGSVSDSSILAQKLIKKMKKGYSFFEGILITRAKIIGLNEKNLLIFYFSILLGKKLAITIRVALFFLLFK